MSQDMHTSRRIRNGFLIAGLICLGIAIPAARVQGYKSQEPTPVSSASPTSAVAFEQKTKTNANLPSRRYSISFDPARLAHALEPLDSGGIQKTAPNQIGVGREVNLSFQAQSSLFTNADGSRVRVFVLKSPGALGMRIHFERFNLSAGDEVYVYGLSDESLVSGPYSRRGPLGDGKQEGDFWSDTIDGDTAIIELFTRSDEANFYISEISHIFEGVFSSVSPAVLACHNDAMCFNDFERDSVARILYIRGASSFVCTGTMMTNRPGDLAPFFLTANHCVTDQAVASTVEAYWFYRTTSCNSGVVSGGFVRTPAGANLLVTQQTADSSLIRILNPVPGLVYSGWDPGARSTGTSVFGLSHPGGGTPPSTLSYLRRASGSITSTTDSCGATGLVSGLIADWTSGLVEPGSSGSGLWSTDGPFLIGVLSCGPVTPACADFALYGKFSNFYPTAVTYFEDGDTAGICAASTLNAGQTISSTLTGSDCRSRVRSISNFCDRYSFTGSAGQQISITLNSAGFDTYLYLLNPNRAVIAQDDDGGGGTDSRIPAVSGTFTLPATGLYTIEVDTFSAGATGNYTLTLGPTTTCHSVSSISPSSGSVGTNVTITGNNFTGVTGVRFFNNINATFTINSNNQITATVPNGAQTGPITISKTGCPDAQTTTFTVTTPPPQCPSVNSISPSSGGVGTNVTINGNNFTGVTSVRFFNNVNALFTINSNNQITATVPNGAADGPITISKTGCPDAQTSFFDVVTGPCLPVSISTSLTGSTGSSVTVPVTVGSLTGQNVVSFDFVLNFNSSVMTLQNPSFDTFGTLSSGMTITPNTSTPGRLTLSAFGTAPLSGSGTLINIRFNVTGSTGSVSDLTWTSFRFNEGNPCSSTSNGRLTVGGGEISGSVTFCASSPPRPVPGVVVSASGSPSGSNTTASNGTYRITNLGGGPYTVTPSKTGNVNGISSFDAALVAQAAAGLITLTTCQQTAGDASNNGSLSSFDASLIAQFAAGVSGGQSIAGTWKFTPANRTYGSLGGSQSNQNFEAVLVGDVSGNWVASSTSAEPLDPQSSLLDSFLQWFEPIHDLFDLLKSRPAISQASFSQTSDSFDLRDRVMLPRRRQGFA